MIGGGIAGPVAAMALQRAGIQATVYEAHPRSTEGIGIFLTLASNGIDAMRTIDADRPALAAGFPTPGILLRSTIGKDLGVPRTGLSLPDGTTSHTMKRADLTGRSTTRPPPPRHRGRAGNAWPTSTRPATGVRAIFEDGSDAAGEVLIGADGIHSAVRRLIDPNAPAPTYVGQPRRLCPGHAGGGRAGQLHPDLRQTSLLRLSPGARR